MGNPLRVGTTGHDMAGHAQQKANVCPLNDRIKSSGEPMNLFARVFDSQAERAPSPHARKVKRKLAAKARQLAKEVETAKQTTTR